MALCRKWPVELNSLIPPDHLSGTMDILSMGCTYPPVVTGLQQMGCSGGCERPPAPLAESLAVAAAGLFVGVVAPG